MKPSLLLAASALCGSQTAFVSSFSTNGAAFRSRTPMKLDMFFATEAADDDTAAASTTKESMDVKLTPLDGSETSVISAAKFMVDSFWLQSPQNLIDGGGDLSSISDASKSSLTNIQADDLLSKYGERMGKRKLDALIVVASDGSSDTKSLSADDILGLVTIEVRLLNSNDLLSADESEFRLTQAVASLGPKQRREYKDASVLDIVRELLPPEVTAVCSLSNLCTSPKARRMGIAAKLCSEAERLTKEELSFDEIYLRVESENEAAKKLYENKLGYQCKFEASATALRVDAERGGFVEVDSDIVVMSKKL
mmetsp:Transcript_24660/g.49181  ORF Transcript_24660/g.49181 Transcript_24660/m.49181 type:complete len:310 (+) Transcript_24660:68-997(+)